MKIIFYISYPYYFPHFLPISKVCIENKCDVIYVLSTEQNTDLMIDIAKRNNLNYELGVDKLFFLNSDIVFFANYFEESYKIKSKTIFMDHGIGTKYCNYEKALNQFDIVLVEGDYRYNFLKNDYPELINKVRKIGFSKLDDVVNFSQEDDILYKSKYNLDETKKTILYAPTFFPSSIEKMSDNFPKDLSEYNIIVKPHYLSLHRSRYKKKQNKFKKWAKYDNCTICNEYEYSLIPFLKLADIMISDESSAIFKFTAFNKPVIINKFLKLRWTYYLNPKKLLKRLDKGIDKYRLIADNANNYKEMLNMIKDNINNPGKFENQRLKFSKDLCGTIDGKVSQRIYNLTMDLKNEISNNK